MTYFIGNTFKGENIMSDLIIKLNLKASTQQYCLVETYVGHLKSLKKRTYSGPLKVVDVLRLECAENLSDLQLEKIKNFLFDESRQVKKNKYLLSYSSFEKFLSLLANVKGIYCTSYDRAFHELDGLYMAEFKIAASTTSNSRGRLYLDVFDGEKVYLDNKSYCCNICGKTFIFTGNNLYVIRRIVELSALKGFLASNQSILSESDLYRIRRNAKEPENTGKEITDLHPVPILYVTFAESSITGKLFFSYNGYEVPFNSMDDRLRDEQNGAVYFRSLMEERQAMLEIKKAGWKQSAVNSFVLKNGDSAEKSLSVLLESHFEILTFDHKKICPAKNANFNISYGVDWFEIKATATEDKRNLTHLIDLKSRKRYIELGNQIILLPDAIWENRKIFKQSGGKMIAAKNYIGQIFEILEQPGVSSTFHPDKMIDFENIHILLPTKLDEILRPYQKYCVRWLLYLYHNNLGGCLADDMGLGKTIQAIAFIASRNLKEKKPMRVLIVTPKTLIENWRAEFKKFGEGICVSIYYEASKESALKGFEQTGGVLLTTYNILLNDIEILSKLFFHCMFIDEAQYIKNYRTKTYAAAKKMKVRSKFILSGTPFENNISELWALMDLINPRCLGNRTAFMKKYGDLSDKAIVKRLNARIKPFVLRRLKKDVLKELPEKTELNVICDMYDMQRELYESILMSVKNELVRMPGRFEIMDASTILEGLLYLRQVCCHPALLKKVLNWNHCDESGKFDLFKIKIDELQANHEKVVVFSQFTTMLGIMKKWADDKGYTTFYLDGTIGKRQEVVDCFERANEGIFFISLKAGGIGLNIVSCQYAIIYEPWWNPAVENQAADRIYRIGQKKNVFVYHLVTANSIEEKIEDLKTGKREIADNLLIDTDEFGKLSIDELKRLIME
ncbi:MAG: ATP-dependent helicase HepA [Pelotomaculum sp. PtaB.Bin104]|nr:MAG: ATP-dependent helicase HepA [Pelotomaculum sp. PtaB.Bin104]